MRYFIGKYIKAVVVVSFVSILWLITPTALAQETEAAGLNVITIAGSDLQVRLYDYTAGVYIEPDPGNPGDSPITWNNANFSQPQGWVIADQCLEITHTTANPQWGIQIYTDNEKTGAEPAIPRYTGPSDPTGLIGVTTTSQALPMAWIAYKDWNPATSAIPEDPATNPYAESFVGGQWHWLKDINTPDNESTEDFDESFHPGEDYVTIWNQLGVAVSDRGRAGDPTKTYAFLAANFSKATKQYYKTSTLTAEHFIDTEMEVFPYSVYKEGAPAEGMAFEYINSKMNKYFKGAELRLIESYSNPADYGHNLPAAILQVAGELSGKAFTYDNALAICALLTNPNDMNLYQAKVLCKSFIWAQDNIDADGRFRDAYDATQELAVGYTQPDYGEFISSNSGNIAWAIIALAQYFKNSGDTSISFKKQVLRTAIDAGEFLHTYFKDDSNHGYFYVSDEGSGRTNKCKSTENNIAIYVAFSHLYDLTTNGKWLVRANNAKSFVMDVARRQSEKRFICGLDANGDPNEDVLAADCNLLAILGINGIPAVKQYLEYVTGHFYTTYQTDGGCIDENNLFGIDFGYINGMLDEPDGVWFEGTAQLASVCQLPVTSSEADAPGYLNSIKLAQYSALYADYKGITAASDVLTTGLGYNYYPFPHIGATAWYITASREYNMLWGTSLNAGVPIPTSKQKYTAEITEYDTDYLQNHYIASGWMNGGINMYTDPRCIDGTDLDNRCFKIHYNGERGQGGWWNGLVWQEPKNIWGNATASGVGYDLRGATKLKFRARAEAIDEELLLMIYMGYEAEAPGIGDSCGSIPYQLSVGDIPDPIAIENTDNDKLFIITDEWQDIEIDLEAARNQSRPFDLSHVANGFTISGFGDPSSGPIELYIDDVRYEND